MTQQDDQTRVEDLRHDLPILESTLDGSALPVVEIARFLLSQLDVVRADLLVSETENEQLKARVAELERLLKAETDKLIKVRADANRHWDDIGKGMD